MPDFMRRRDMIRCAVLQELSLLPTQLQALQASCRELLLAAEPQSGASHALRAMALVRAFTRERTHIVIAGEDRESSREQHVRGPGGLWELLKQPTEAGAVEWMPDGRVKLANHSTIRVTSWEHALRGIPADVLLLDDAERLSFQRYQQMRDRTLRTPIADDAPSLVVSSHAPHEGWVRDHFASTGNGSGCARVEMRASELPDAFRQRVAEVARAVALSFADFIARVMPDYPGEYWHLRLLVETLQRVVEGEILRLLIEAPPRVLKSITVSCLLPAYFLHRFPHLWAAVLGADDGLTLRFSKDARVYYGEAGGLFRMDSRDARLWRTLLGGGMWARSMGQGALGYGYSLGIVDDPFTSWANAQRISVQSAADSWLWSTIMNRRDLGTSPPARLILMQQRLSESDLIGGWIGRESKSGEPAALHPTHILHLPAIKRPRREPFPRSMVVIQDPRQDGEELCAELQSREEILEIERTTPGAEGIYGQDPLPSQGGGLFERWWWPEACDARLVREMREFAGFELNDIIAELQRRGLLPAFVRQVRAWDYAATEGAGDFSASCRSGITLDGRFVHLDAFDRQVHESLVKSLVLETARRDGRGVEVVLPQDPGAAGKIMVTDFKAALEAEGFRVITASTQGSKWVKAVPHATAARWHDDGREGKCSILPGPWTPRWLEQHHRFDGVTKPMDLVDATASAYNELASSPFTRLRSGLGT